MALMPKTESHKEYCRLSSVLSYAVREWSLMLLLFLNAIFSYLVTKFARFCNLQTPCLLCSRLDHIFGQEKPGFYRDLICESHKSEISLFSCYRTQQELANAHEICEGCIIPFATEKQSAPAYKLLVDKIETHPDDNVDDFGLPNSSHERDVVELPLLNRDPVSDYLVTNHCPYCSVQLRNKLDAVGFLKNKPNSTGHKHHQVRLNKILEESSGSTLINHTGNHGLDHLSRIGYSEVKVTSDSESEAPLSDDDGGITVSHEIGDLKEDAMGRCLQPEPDTFISNELSETISDNIALEKLTHTAAITVESSLPIPEKQLVDIDSSHDASSETATVAIEHGLEEINWTNIEVRNNPPVPCESISERVLSEVPNGEENHDVVCLPTISSEQASNSLNSTEVNLNLSQISESCPSVPDHMDLNDAYKLATGNKSNLPSPNVSEVITGRDSFRAYEDLKLLISQMSAARGLETPWNDLSPSPRLQGDVSSSEVLQNITKRLSIERNESGLESLDGSIVSEIEGESVVDRLKRQLELDRKSLYLLYKELEEERSASAIAANQAMAMITRLQEEKAALQVEALQYQRMMEEQAEYDQEVLQQSNELLAEREKDIQHLEADIERYRKQIGNESLEVNLRKPSGHSLAVEHNLTSTLGKEFMVSSMFEKSGSINLNDPFLGFEDEKAYISDCLKRLEEKLRLFSINGFFADMSKLDLEEDRYLNKPIEDDGENNQQTNGQHSEMAARSTDLEHPHWNVVPQQCSHMDDGVLGEDSSLYRDDCNAKTSSSLSTQGPTKNYHKESFISATSNCDSQDLSNDVKGSNLASVQVEVSHLNERLEALEADCNFLEHTIKTLRNGDNGTQFILEIACNLQELRRICIMRREHSVA
ncbi:myosin-binding protein 1-like [Iris pallida]|uniref:Myosin-binding protein 1-like n=1 Tax=Iris pallida TaxID=29817 RepID=A0AAX6HGI8_IRIPA|nr:myosin-binding protein 1-like [Iris pallida]